MAKLFEKMFEKIGEHYDGNVMTTFVLGGCASISLVTTYLSLKNLSMATKYVLDMAKKEK